ncbi:unnamed protein product [Linum tenue]|uniref:Uncharacterized protein n=1 Tax=Linum tenue TaxID=586396 RepID=A0AAV0L2M2_9ROSI|nr:unnamed protein product [Linum tenue]
MQQGDQTVLSLRPGGGRGSSRLFNQSSSSLIPGSNSNSSGAAAAISFGDLSLLRPHGGASALKVQSLALPMFGSGAPFAVAIRTCSSKPMPAACKVLLRQLDWCFIM